MKPVETRGNWRKHECCAQVKHQMFRVRDAEIGKKNCKTCERYFASEHRYVAASGDEEVVTRYAEILDIFVLEIDERDFILVRASWFQAAASYIDTVTQTTRLRTDLARDNTKEDIVEAKNITNQVAVVPLPFLEHRAVVLDRRFDTLTIPGAT